jgi:rod shape-determining protein MreD
VFAVFAFLAIIFEISLRGVFLLPSLGNVSPSFVFVLVVFVALFAPRTAAIWAAWVLGLLVDLCTDLPHGDGRAGPLIGPHALGFAFGAYLVLQIRPMLFRRRSLTIAVVTTLAFITASLLIVSVYTIQTWYPSSHQQLVWSDMRPAGELLRRIGIAIYTGLLAWPLAPILLWTLPLWGFRPAGQRVEMRR